MEDAKTLEVSSVKMRLKQVVVPEALDNVGEQLAGLVQDIRKALADGWQPGEDIAAIFGSSISRFAGAIKDWDEIAPATKQHLPESIKSVALNAVDAVFLPTT